MVDVLPSVESVAATVVVGPPVFAVVARVVLVVSLGLVDVVLSGTVVVDCEVGVTCEVEVEVDSEIELLAPELSPLEVPS